MPLSGFNLVPQNNKKNISSYKKYNACCYQDIQFFIIHFSYAYISIEWNVIAIKEIKHSVQHPLLWSIDAPIFRG